MKRKNCSQHFFTHAEEERRHHVLPNLTNLMLVKSNFQLDASDFVYVKYDVHITTSLMFYLPQDLTSPREIFPTFHETKYLHKNVRLKCFANTREKYLAHVLRSFSSGRKKS